MSTTKNILKSITILTLVFCIHRIITFKYLNDQFIDSEFSIVAKAYLIGTMSDFWTAILGSLLLFLVEQVLSRFRKPRLVFSFRCIYIGLLVFFTSLHSAYVSFFQFPFIPSHSQYFIDTAFLQANFRSVFDILVIFSLVTSLVAWKVIEIAFNKINVTAKKLHLWLGFIIFFGALLHVLHNRFKVQWFVPDKLQYNLFEGYAYKLTKQVELPKLGRRDLELLNIKYGYSEKLTSGASLEQILLREQEIQSDDSLLPLGMMLKTNYSKLKNGGKKPLVIIYLMESSRYYDTGIYGVQKKSLTPNFDKLARDGILFHQVWSVSNVTRGGQEAVWCGYLSGIDRSLMKERQDIDFKCLPDYPESGTTFWHHAGVGLFDNQEWFWQKHHVDSTLSLVKFPDNIVKTGWGGSDLSLVKNSVKIIENLTHSSQEPVLTGMVLTVSNHIPWEVPSDAPKEIETMEFSGTHPSEKTVFYADYALGEFVKELKNRSLWDRSILIITGDHGIKAPALNPAFSYIPPDELNTRIPLLVSGGISEKTGDYFTQSERQIKLNRSQADIANFIAHLNDISGFTSMGEHLFTKIKTKPIIADLGPSVYFPIGPASIFKNKLIPDNGSKIPQEQLLYYVSLLHYINGSS